MAASHRIVDDHQVEPAVVIHIDPAGGEAIIPFGVADPGLNRYFGERAVASVEEEEIPRSLQAARTAKDLLGAVPVRMRVDFRSKSR